MFAQSVEATKKYDAQGADHQYIDIEKLQERNRNLLRPPQLASTNITIPQVTQTNINSYYQSKQKFSDKENLNQEISYQKYNNNTKQIINNNNVIFDNKTSSQYQYDPKNNFEFDSEDSKKLKLDLEHKLIQMRDQLLKKDRIITELEFKLNNFNTDSNVLVEENTNLKEQLLNMQQQSTCKIKELEDKFNNTYQRLKYNEESYQKNIEHIKIEHTSEVQNINNNWESMFKTGEEKYRQLVQIRENLEQELTQFKENYKLYKLEQQEQFKNAVAKVQEEENIKFSVSLKQVEMKIRVAEEVKENIIKKNQEIIRELQDRDRQIHEQYLHFETEVARISGENQELKSQLELCNKAIDRLKDELIMKDNTNKNIEQELDELQKIVQYVKEQHKIQIDRVMREQRNERISWDHQKETFKQKISELDQIVHKSRNETAKIQTEYEKLCNALQQNINQTIVTTLGGRGAKVQRDKGFNLENF